MADGQADHGIECGQMKIDTHTDSAALHETGRLQRVALALAFFTIFYNLAEGLVSIFFGVSDESLTLFGFGIDSFIEVLSGIGIAHMLLRTFGDSEQRNDRFERTALRITGTAFYLLAAGLVSTAAVNIWTSHRPEVSVAGIIISIVSIATMWALMRAKISVGRRLGSAAIVADAGCTKVCIYMSIVLLMASGLYALIRLPHFDTAGAVALAFFSFREGRECFEKAENNQLCCSCDSDVS